MTYGMFTLGQTMVTRGVLSLLEEVEMYNLLSRHATGDWGDLCKEDKDVNESALVSGKGRLFSSYKTPKGKIWIITEADRSVTTVLLPDEY